MPTLPTSIASQQPPPIGETHLFARKAKRRPLSETIQYVKPHVPDRLEELTDKYRASPDAELIGKALFIFERYPSNPKAAELKRMWDGRATLPSCERTVFENRVNDLYAEIESHNPPARWWQV